MFYFIIFVTLAGCTNEKSHETNSKEKPSSIKEEQSRSNKLHTIKIDGIPLHVEIAQDDATLQKGLMFREDLPENTGMLFVFPYYRILSFWMRNTFLPLDIAFINQEGVIVDIQTVDPLDETRHYISNAPALYALEVKAGGFKNNNIKVGSKVQLKI